MRPRAAWQHVAMVALLLLLQPPVRAVVPTIAGTDTNCSFSLRHGLKKDGRGTPTLRLVYSEGVLEAQPTTDAEIFAQRPHLCWLDRDQTSTKPVLLMVANSLPYVFHEWPYFANKVAFARKSHWNAVLWLGELPRDIATTVGPWCCASAVGAKLKLLAKNFGRKKVNCSASFADEQAATRLAAGARRLAYKGVGRSSYAGSEYEVNSNHHAKMAAASLLLRNPRVRDVFYMDLDSYVRPEDVKKAASGAKTMMQNTYDVVLNEAHGPRRPTKPHPFWLAGGMRWYLRATPFSVKFVDGWLRHRCGFKDQYALWHTLLTLADGVAYDGEIGRLPYNQAKYAALKPTEIPRKWMSRDLLIGEAAVREVGTWPVHLEPESFGNRHGNLLGEFEHVSTSCTSKLATARGPLEVVDLTCKVDMGKDLLSVLGLDAVDAEAWL